MVIIAGFCAVYTLEDGYAHISAVCEAVSCSGCCDQLGGVGDQLERILRAAATLVKNLEVMMVKERVQELQLLIQTQEWKDLTGLQT